MSGPIRTRTYTGATPAEAAHAFEADAFVAARAGYYPTSQAWSGSSLTVVYQFRDNDWSEPRSGGGGFTSAVGQGIGWPLGCLVFIVILVLVLGALGSAR